MTDLVHAKLIALGWIVGRSQDGFEEPVAYPLAKLWGLEVGVSRDHDEHVQRAAPEEDPRALWLGRVCREHQKEVPRAPARGGRTKEEGRET